MEWIRSSRWWDSRVGTGRAVCVEVSWTGCSHRRDAYLAMYLNTLKYDYSFLLQVPNFSPVARSSSPVMRSLRALGTPSFVSRTPKDLPPCAFRPSRLTGLDVDVDLPLRPSFPVAHSSPRP